MCHVHLRFSLLSHRRLRVVWVGRYGGGGETVVLPPAPEEGGKQEGRLVALLV